MVIISSVDMYSLKATMEASEEQLNRCDVFDPKGYAYGLSERVCKKGSPCPLLVFLYACMGLHRYNFLKGTKFEPSRMKKYVKSTTSASKCYYITLDAKEPAGSPQTFQTKVSEGSIGELVLSCTIARIRGEISDEQGKVYVPGKGTHHLLGKHLPEWPPENPFERCCLVKKESELENKDKDWIHLYLELAIATSDWQRDKRKPKDYEDLKILELATNEGLNAKNATFYIRFKDSYRARLGKTDFDRIAIVRRRFDEDEGFFSLEGQILSSQVIPKKRISLANEEDTGCFSHKGQNQSSEMIEFCQDLSVTGLPKQISSPLATREAANQQAINSGDEDSAGELMV